MRSSRRTRLMMTADAVGGVWTYAADLLCALAERNYQTRLVTTGPRPSVAQREMIAGIPALSIVETDLKLEWQDPGGADTDRAAEILSDIALDFAPDVVHLNSFREAAVAWPCPVVVVAHSCVNTWSQACGETLQGDAWHEYTRAVTTGLRSADAWVSPSVAFREALRRSYARAPKGRVIYNGLAQLQQPAAEKSPLVFGAGRAWDRAKNLASLAAAANDTVWPVQIAGPCGDTASSDARLPPGAVHLGAMPRERVLERMRDAEIFCSPARYEPFGLSVLEAASAGCALVLSDIPTFRELWDDAAVFVDPCDPHALASALNDLCRDNGRRQQLQKAAVARARRYSIVRAAGAYHALYSSLLFGTRFQRPVELSA